MASDDRDGETIEARLAAALERRTSQREKIALLIQSWRAAARDGGPTHLPESLGAVLDRETLVLGELDEVVRQLEASWLAATARR